MPKPQNTPTMNLIVLVTIAAVFLVFTLSITFAARAMFNNSVENAKDTDINNTTQVAYVLRDNFDNLAQLLNLSQKSIGEIDFHSPGADASAEQIVLNLMDIRPDVYSMWYVLDKGVVFEDEFYIREYVNQNGKIAGGASLTPENLNDRTETATWYYKPWTTGQPYYELIDYVDVGAGGAPVPTAKVSAPIVINGQIAGVCGVSMFYEDMLIGVIHDLHTEQGRVVNLISRDLIILHSFDHDYNGQSLADFGYDAGDLDTIEDELVWGNTYSTELVSPFLGEKVFEYFQPIFVDGGEQENPIFLQIGTPLKALYADAYRTIFLFVGNGAACLLLITIIIIFSTRRIVQPIMSLTRGAQVVAEGNYSRDVFEPFESDGQDNKEVSILRSTLKNMLKIMNENLQTVESRVTERTRDLQRSNNYIKQLMEYTSTVSLLLDSQTRVIFISEKIVNLMMIDNTKDFSGMPLREIQEALKNTEYLERSRQRMERIFTGDEDLFVVDDYIHWPNGENRLYRITYKRVLDSDGELDGIVIVMRDLTDVRHEEAEHRISDMLTSAMLPCFIWDEEGALVAYNEEAAGVFRIPEGADAEECNQYMLTTVLLERQPDGSDSETMRLDLIREALDNGFSQNRFWLDTGGETLSCFTVNVTRVTWLFGFRLVVYCYDLTDIMRREAEAKAAEERIRLMFEATPLGCMLMDEELNVLDCNDALVGILGVPNKEALFDGFLRYSPEYQPDGQLSAKKAVAVTRETIEKGRMIVEWLHLGADGEPIPVEVTLVRINRGDRYVINTYIRDLREQKKMLAEIGRRDRLLLASSQAAALLLHSEADSFEDDLLKCMGMIGRAVDVDRVCVWKNAVKQERLYCALDKEWLGPSGAETNAARLVDVSYDDVLPEWESALADGKCITGLVKDMSESVKKQLTTFGVKSIFIAPVFMNEDFWGYIGFDDFYEERIFTEDEQTILQSSALFIADALLRHTQTIEIKEANERTQLMLDSNPQAIIMRDYNNQVIDCNQAALDIFGFTDKKEFCGNFYSFYPDVQPNGKDSYTEAIKLINRLIEDGAMESFEWMFQTFDGESLPMEVKFVLIHWKDSIRILSYYRDLREIRANEQKLLEITEREKKAEIEREAAEAANEAKSRFLANMSHEIRTPMNAILGMAELLLHENLNGRQQRYVEDMRESAMALLGIINDILDVSKIQSGKMSLVPVHYDFDLLIDNVGAIASHLAENKNIAFKLRMQQHQPLYLFGDDIRLRQLLINLLGNAIKFTNEGYVNLSICFTDSLVKMVVSDTGVGIPPENIPTLFDPFEQADVLKNRSTKGTGLGLTISRSIVEMMEGQISVESVYGKGTTFRVEFPKVLGDADLIHRVSDREIIVSAPEARVLVVDDNQTNLAVATGLLNICQIKADTAMSGPQAIQMLRESKYDLVFMDHRMPEMSGVETTQAIHGLGIDVPIVALTASAVIEAREKMLAAGMNDYLSKPIIKAELMAVLQKWLPAEKVTVNEAAVSAADAIEDETFLEFWEMVGQIQGLSLLTGLDRVDGQRDVYEKTLRLLMQEIEKSDNNLQAYLLAGDLENFRTEVHGIKGALANVGAMPLSLRAYDLEMAADRLDAAFCAENLPGLLTELGQLNEELNQAFAVVSQVGGPIVIPPELPSIFERMTGAFAEIDLVSIDGEIEKLNALNLTGALKEAIERIKDAVMMMDYDGANELIKQLLKSA